MILILCLVKKNNIIMKRSEFLKKFGLAGVAVVSVPSIGVAIDDSRDEPSNENLLNCTEAPSETAGPYPLPNSVDTSGVFRSDITENQTGIPLDLTITVTDTEGNCDPVSNLRVDIWHCNKRGYYSAYSGQPGIDGTVNTTGEVWLRGIQMTDSNGEVNFQTIYPGWYIPRATHIHVQIFDAEDNLLKTTQLAFPDSINSTVNSYYSTSGQNQHTNSNDMVFSDSYAEQMLTVSGDTTNGYTASGNIAINAADLGISEVEGFSGGQISGLKCLPNPVKEDAYIAFKLVQASEVSFALIDISGKIIKEFDAGNLNAGQQALELNIANLEGGMYLLRLQVSNHSGSYSQTVKILKK